MQLQLTEQLLTQALCEVHLLAPVWSLAKEGRLLCSCWYVSGGTWPAMATFCCSESYLLNRFNASI